MIADAVVALLMHAQSSAAAIRLTSRPCRHSLPTGEDGQPARKKPREAGDDESSTQSRLRCIHNTLSKQYDLVEAIYGLNDGTFEIKLDTALESGVMDDDGMLTVTAKVEFDDETGNNAKITVESKDKKIASSVRDCLRSLCTSMAPISV
jgi:Pre-mRNA 3'-end-processing endonuclease polyadenylation factor C-term